MRDSSSTLVRQLEILLIFLTLYNSLSVFVSLPVFLSILS